MIEHVSLDEILQHQGHISCHSAVPSCLVYVRNISGNLGNIPEIHVLRHCTAISVFCNLQSTIQYLQYLQPTSYILQSTIYNPQSTIYNLQSIQSTSYKLQATIYKLQYIQPTTYNLHSTIRDNRDWTCSRDRDSRGIRGKSRQ